MKNHLWVAALMIALSPLTSNAENLVESSKDLNFRLKSTQDLLFGVASNAEQDRHYQITQKELQGVLRIIHRDDLSAMDLINLKLNLNLDSRYSELSVDQKIDLEKVMTDVSWVRSRMSEYEFFSKFHCRFAVRDNPLEELPNDSFIKNPAQYRDQMPREIIDQAEETRGDRAVIGMCWDKAEKDILNSWTQEIRKKQFQQ